MADFNRTEDMSRAIVPGGSVAAGVLREAEAWTTAQSELLNGIEAMWSECMKRQREAVDASARSLHQMSECRNLVDLVQLQQRWLAEAARRGACDISSLASDAVALTWRVARAGPPGSRGPNAPTPARAPAASGEDTPLQREAAE